MSIVAGNLHTFWLAVIPISLHKGDCRDCNIYLTKHCSFVHTVQQYISMQKGTPAYGKEVAKCQYQNISSGIGYY